MSERLCPSNKRPFGSVILSSIDNFLHFSKAGFTINPLFYFSYWSVVSGRSGFCVYILGILLESFAKPANTVVVGYFLDNEEIGKIGNLKKI